MLKKRFLSLIMIAVLAVCALPSAGYAAEIGSKALVDYMDACAPTGDDPRYGQGGTGIIPGSNVVGNQKIYFFNGHSVEKENGGVPSDTALMANQYGYNYTLKTATPFAADKWENYIIGDLDSTQVIKFGITYSGNQTGNEDNLTNAVGGYFRTNFLPKAKIKDSNNQPVLGGEQIFKQVIFQGYGFRGNGGAGRARGGDILFEIPANTLKGGSDYKLVIEKGIVLNPDGEHDFHIDKDIEFNFSTKAVPAAVVTSVAKYRVKLYARGGKFKGGKKIKIKTVVKNKRLGKITAPKRKGYKFQGWYTKKVRGKKYTAKSKIRKNIKLYAHWARNARVNTDGGNLYLRSKAGLSGKIRAKFRDGTGLIVLGSKENWYKVTIGNKTGYMYKKYIKLAAK